MEFGPAIAHGQIIGLTTGPTGGRVKITSTRYRELVVHDLGVTFIDGEAEVTDWDTIEALCGLPTDLGVRAAGGRLPKEPTQS